MFEHSIELFDIYYRELDAKGVPSFNKELGVELRERLKQMGWILAKIRVLLSRQEKAQKRVKRVIEAHVERIRRDGLDFESESQPPDSYLTEEESRELDCVGFELKLLTECFYYIAGRARSILRHKEGPLPGLTHFEAIGVRNVRNKLLEHPEGADSRVFTVSFGSGANGPVLKPGRLAGQQGVFPDSGLFANAREFATSLENVLAQAVGMGDV